MCQTRFVGKTAGGISVLYAATFEGLFPGMAAPGWGWMARGMPPSVRGNSTLRSPDGHAAPARKLVVHPSAPAGPRPGLIFISIERGNDLELYTFVAFDI